MIASNACHGFHGTCQPCCACRAGGSTQAMTTVGPITPHAYWARAIASESGYTIVEEDAPPPPPAMLSPGSFAAPAKWCTLLTPIP